MISTALLAVLTYSTCQAAETVCTADLLCVEVDRSVPVAGQPQPVSLILNNRTHKPLSFRLFLHGLDDFTSQPALYLAGPHQRTLATFDQPSQPWGFEYRVHFGHTRHEHCQACIYTLPYAPGKGYLVSQSYTNLSTHHLGNRFAIDWAMPVGDAVHAARGGRVVSTYGASNAQGTTGAATANHIWVQHDDGTVGKYLHMAFAGVLVDEGEQVQSGQHIGISGNTGFTHGPHLHFSVSTLGGQALYETFNIKFDTEFGVQVLAGGRSYTRLASRVGRQQP